MKHKLLAAVATAALLFPAVTSFAMIDESDLVLGGLTLGEPIRDAIDIYGEPDNVGAPALSYEDGYMVYWHDLQIGYDYDSNKEETLDSTITEIITTVPNGIATGKGIQGGASVEDVTAAYGDPDRTWNDWRTGRVVYLYYTGNNPRRDPYLSFTFVNDVVRGISCAYPTGE